ncbi:hypothetical protein [Candidatus Nitrosopumilus sediminis]|uniref:Uncharacterized protein n=1 Tax=Candidatus Nitrosopumilus sediminis TaxID=1229909 RepID=K0BD44_9ARCH|nr:hypothetical protein [Candidatus Nitrosopumilus sediminis]AFS82977.1 hypothetical protein NSED_05875 [Candidatus Nitrosopumilus sediminis]
MLKKIILSLFVALVIVGFTNSVNGELQATLWVPDEILLKEKYQGTIIIDTKTNEDVTFDIITDNEEVLKIITESITVPKGKHHGLIQIETIGSGNAKVFAISQDVLLEKSVTVVESADTPAEIDLILPSDLVNVLADENIHTGYVFLLNNFENPVTAKQDVLVDLTSNGEIELVTKSITITPGKHYVKFQFKAQGEGSISASAQNLLPDEETISLEDLDEIELMMGVGPDPIPTDSTGEIYFWLERDGKPYIPSHDVKVTISIDKSSNLSFDSAMRGAIVLTPNTAERGTTNTDAQKIITRTEVQLSHDSQKTFTIKGGSHYGKLTAYTSFDSAGDINISGLAESISPSEDEETIKSSNIFSTSTEKSTNDLTTETKIYAFPDPAYKDLEIIVSSFSDNGPVIEDDDEKFTLFSDNKLQLEKSSGIIKTEENYEIIKARVVDFGDAVVFAERNEAESEEINIETSGKYVKDPELSIVTLPIIFNIEQDLFLISSSQEKIITDAKEDGNLISITSRPSFDFEVMSESESVITVHGKISESLEDEPKIHVSSNAFTTQDTLEIYNPDRKILVSLHPNSVYPGEVFPIVNHIDDLNSNPIRKSTLKVSSVTDMGTIDGLFYFNQTGTHDIIFYDKNSIPIKSTITVKGAPVNPRIIGDGEQKPTTITYDITVHDGEGSGKYEEDEEVTISAAATKDDFVLFKKKLAGWENLPYKDSTVTFEADDDIETRPIYQDDYSLLLLIAGSGGGGVAFMIVKKK